MCHSRLISFVYSGLVLSLLVAGIDLKMSLNTNRKVSKSYGYRKIKKQLNQCIELSDLDFRSSKVFNNQFHGDNDYVNINESNEVSENLGVVGEQVAANEQTANQILTLETSDCENLNSENSVSSDSNVSSISTDGNNRQSEIFLRNWALRNNITHNSLSELLTWFATNPNIAGLPKSARSLLKTPSSLTVFLFWTRRKIASFCLYVQKF